MYCPAVLSILLWIPYIAAGVSQYGLLTPAQYKVPGSRVLPEWANRARRAHLNLLENLASFTALILIAHLTGISTEATAATAAVFFWARVAQTAVHIMWHPIHPNRCLLRWNGCATDDRVGDSVQVKVRSI